MWDGRSNMAVLGVPMEAENKVTETISMNRLQASCCDVSEHAPVAFKNILNTFDNGTLSEAMFPRLHYWVLYHWVPNEPNAWGYGKLYCHPLGYISRRRMGCSLSPDPLG